MNRRKPVEVEIGGETYKAALITCGVSWKLAEEIRVIRETMLKAVREEKLSPEEEAAYYPAAIALASAILVPHDPQCTEEWVAENVTDHELGVILAKVWPASQPPIKGGGGSPEAKSP